MKFNNINLIGRTQSVLSKLSTAYSELKNKVSDDYQKNALKFVLKVLVVVTAILLVISVVISSKYTIPLLGITGALAAAYTGAHNAQIVHDKDELKSEVNEITLVNELIEDLYTRLILVTDTDAALSSLLRGYESDAFRAFRAIFSKLDVNDITYNSIKFSRYGYLHGRFSKYYEPLFYEAETGDKGNIIIDLTRVDLDFVHFYKTLQLALIRKESILQNIEPNEDGNLLIPNNNFEQVASNTSFATAIETVLEEAPETAEYLFKVTSKLIIASQECFSKQAIAKCAIYDPIGIVYKNHKFEKLKKIFPPYKVLESSISNLLEQDYIEILGRKK
ncbi:hypothetical protein [Pseudidiomarina andamanensis]|uniref:Uncharacterized protein n=1 Tax=Pseudidiomarina andamanensis TaxID=1940690 RepID=A0AA92ILH3_9GAMM|nr:hypothetical protein [Pseudidiomarina andamanensis]MDS0218625.1 hypothetical protein [Pseudidiomarina andamanensis]QGT95490.1 hypothetical protein D3795_04540 [Pseudidiomarina andamanensis]